MPLVAWRVCKERHPAYDGAGAMQQGARWNSPGHAAIYAADSYAGAILELLAHALRPRTLPGPHHAIRIAIPDALVEVLDPDALPGWYVKGSPEARRFGDRWLAEGRTPVLVVPSVPSRPIGRTVMINPAHPAATSIDVGPPCHVPWDDRLF